MHQLYRDLPFEVKAGDAEDKSRFVASSSSEDLAGDTIDPKGWIIDRVKQIPFLWQHNSREPPIGRLDRVFVEGERLIADVLWDLKSERAKELHRQLKEGFISTVSVGFWPLEYKERRDDKQRFLGFDFTKQRLLELSLVNIPANPDAGVLQRSHELALLHREEGKLREIKETARGGTPHRLLLARTQLAKHRERAAHLSGV